MQWYAIKCYRFIINQSLYIPDFEFSNQTTEECYYNNVKDFLDCDIVFDYGFFEVDDLVDAWIHKIEYEGEVDDFKGDLSICIGGENACPPEDALTPDGYKEFLKVVMDKNHPDREKCLVKHFLIDWEERLDFDPSVFDLSTAKIRHARPLQDALSNWLS